MKGIRGFLKNCPQGKGRMYLTKNIYPHGKHVRCWLQHEGKGIKGQ